MRSTGIRKNDPETYDDMIVYYETNGDDERGEYLEEYN